LKCCADEWGFDGRAAVWDWVGILSGVLLNGWVGDMKGSAEDFDGVGILSGVLRSGTGWRYEEECRGVRWDHEVEC
jgi:hypothetical protein